jgi:hypothetical protein
MESYRISKRVLSVLAKVADPDRASTEHIYFDTVRDLLTQDGDEIQRAIATDGHMALIHLQSASSLRYYINEEDDTNHQFTIIDTALRRGYNSADAELADGNEVTVEAALSYAKKALKMSKASSNIILTKEGIQVDGIDVKFHPCSVDHMAPNSIVERAVPKTLDDYGYASGDTYDKPLWALTDREKAQREELREEHSKIDLPTPWQACTRIFQPYFFTLIGEAGKALGAKALDLYGEHAIPVVTRVTFPPAWGEPTRVDIVSSDGHQAFIAILMPMAG